MCQVLVIAGPTASGKSELGLRLAQHFSGEIISADSIQVYKHLDIGSAKPPQAMLQSVPHHLINVLEPEQTYDAGQFVKQAQVLIQSIQDQGKLPILLGGTGLYLRSLLHGLVNVPPVAEKYKQYVAGLSLGAATQELLRLDPLSAGVLHNNDQQRVRRALAFFLATGQSLTQHQQLHNLQHSNYNHLMFAINWPRNVLYEKINERVLHMLKQGLLDEVQQLLDKNYQPKLSCFQSIGYKQAIAYLQGQLSYQTMVEQIQLQTRRYAKRQLTWLRHQAKVHWLSCSNYMADSIRLVQNFLVS